MVGQKGSTTKGGIRWRPTAEQLMILEELFKGGIKTPTSQQVQKITTWLKEHGKVETKNVFYWFQNHKAREKQKIRRKLMNQQMLISTNNVVYFTNNTVNHHPQPLFASGFLPFFPPQVIKGQWVSSQAHMVDMVTTKDEELANHNTNVSSWAITWLPTDSDSDYRCNNRPLETLQLFPTTASATTETAITATSSSTAVESNLCSSSRILISL